MDHKLERYMNMIDFRCDIRESCEQTFIPPITGKSVTSALSFGRLLRFHHVGIEKGHVIGFSQFQQEL